VPIDFGWTVNHGMGGMLLHAYEPGLKLSNCDWDEGEWSYENIEDIKEALDKITAAFVNVEASLNSETVKNVFGRTTIRPGWRPSSHAFLPGTIYIGKDDRQLTGLEFQYVIVHEFGHVWDKRSGGFGSGPGGYGGHVGVRPGGTFNLSGGLAYAVGRLEPHCYGYTEYSCFTTGEAPPGYIEPQGYNYAARGRLGYSAALDDFADSFASFVVQGYWAYSEETRELDPGSIRWEYVATQIARVAAGN
jgi:hypothetical protein